MDYKKEIPFGAFDSELMRQEIYIPEGFKAIIKRNKIILEKTESKDERIRNVIRGWIYSQPASFFDNGISKEDWLAWLEKQGEQKSAVNFKAKDWYISKVDGKIHNMTHNPTDSNKSKLPMEIFGRKVVLVEDDTSFCDKRCAFFTSGICEASIQWCACEDSKGNTNRHFESVKDDNDTQDSSLPFH